MPGSVYHVLTSPVADVTGTVTVFDAAGGTKTEAASNIVRPSDWNSQHAITIAAVGSEISGAFSNQPGGVTFGLETNGYITAGAPAGGGGITAINVSAGTASNNMSAVTFSNSNGVSFGLNGSVVTATVATNYQSQGAYLTTAALSDHSHGNPQLNLTNLSGTTASNSAGLTLSLSANAPETPFGVSAGTQSVSTGTLVFSNSNGVTFGMSGSSRITASHNGLTTAAASDHSHGNPTLALTNLSGTTASNSAGFTLSLSAAAGGGGADGGNTLIAGTRTAGSNSAVLFDNANGITFGLNAAGGSVMTASHNGLTTARASNDAVGLNTALTAGPLAWTVNSSGISLNAGSAAGTTSGFTGGASISGSMTHNTAGLALSLSHPAWLTTAMQSNAATISNINISAGTTSTNASAFTLNNANGITFGLGTGASAGSITASHNGLTTAALSNHSHGASGQNGSFAFQTLSFSNANGVSFGTSAGSAITASHNGLTTARASNDAVGLNTAQTNVTWTVNSSGISLNAGGYAGTGTSATNASVTLNSNGLAISVGAGGGVTPVASASNGSFSFTTLAFSNANNVTFGTSAGSIVTASVAAPGAAAENNWFALTGNTAGNTTASGSTIALSGGNNITLSGTNGSVIRIDAPASSSLVGVAPISISTNGSTISVMQNSLSLWEPFEFANNTAFSSHGQNTVYMQRLWPEHDYVFSQVEKFASVSFASSTNSQSVAHTIRYGLYVRDTGASSTRMTLTGSSAVIFQASYNSNTTAGFTISQSGGGSYTSNSAGTGFYSQLTAGKIFYFPFASTLSRGKEYAWGFHVSTASAVNTAALRLSFMELTAWNNTTVGRLAVSTMQANSATIYEKKEGLLYSVTSGALPASYADSEARPAVSRARQYMIFETG